MLSLFWIKRNVVYEFEGRKFNVWHIFKSDFYRSFCGTNLASSLWYILSFKELSKHFDKHDKIISICEMQWWEKALYAFSKKKGATTIGVQHTIVPELILNYFNFYLEISDGNFIEKCPLPDYLATVGKIPTDLFIKHGWPKERVFVWGAQRFESLQELSSSVIPWKDKKNYFICAFSIDTLESEKILSLLETAFKGNAVYKIILKSHPSLDISKLILKRRIKLSSQIFEHSEIPLQKIIAEAKGVIVTESSSCFFALACGIPVIIPRFEDKIDCNPLSYLTDIPIYVYSPEDLFSVCNRIVNLTDPPVSYEKCNKFLEEYFYFPKDKGEYLEKIVKLQK